MFDVIKALLKVYALGVGENILVEVNKHIAQLLCYYIVAGAGFRMSFYSSFPLLGLVLYFHGNEMGKQVESVWLLQVCKSGLGGYREKKFVYVKKC